MVERIFAGLTASELRTFALAIEGLNNKEIARRCKVGEQTIKNNMRHIYNATGMNHGRELLAFAYAHPELIAALRAVRKPHEYKL